MKALLVLAATCSLFAGPALRAADTTAPARVEVIFDHPENFTDVKDKADPTEAGREGILDLLRRYIVSEAATFLPAGSELKITFTDIDLAGDFEPWRGPEYDSVRVVKPIYPPAFKFDYRLRDSAGKVLKQGSESIRDLNFEQRKTAEAADSLHFEKDILRDWMRKNLGDLR